MKTTASIEELRGFLKASQGESALVPTMGYLHSGHMKLVEQAKRQADVCIVSIFVNPLQFGPDEDFDEYPRDLKRDLALCEAHGVDFVFHPDVDEMYPEAPEVNLGLKHMSSVLDGISRPGHFEGVITVVNKLFNIIRPDYAVFGEKDRQQLMIVKRLVQDFNHDLEIIGVETERERDGLAKSSRNVNLTMSEREEAPSIHAALTHGRQLIEAGHVSTEDVIREVTDFIETRISGKVDSIDIYSYPDLKEVVKIKEDIVIFAAVKFSKARLIDNMLVKNNV
ncbi:pantoate--beta-alanine ligase [Corticicoccus populi]|uniref:Pantothenate synthetase n=1 Tax=Corticicoccus populi TaxID=1812821 RepID=A0ABW5WSR4_9STAP